MCLHNINRFNRYESASVRKMSKVTKLSLITYKSHLLRTTETIYNGKLSIDRTIGVKT